MVDKSIIVAVLLLTLLLCGVTRCENKCKPKDCIDLKCYRISKGRDGPHTVYPGVAILPNSMHISCDQHAPGSGWTVWMRRCLMVNDTNFNETWDAFKNGFGKQYGSCSEFYLGNELVHKLTKSFPGGKGELRVESVSYGGDTLGMSADGFSLDDETTSYTMHVGNEHDNYHFAPGILKNRSNRPFNIGPPECRAKFGYQKWWYGEKPVCTKMVIFGPHSDERGQRHYQHVFIHTYIGTDVIMKRVYMMLRPSLHDPYLCRNPCMHGGTCEYRAISDSRRCICAEGYCGVNCEYLFDGNTTDCICPKTRCGPHCEIANPCKNDGVCKYIPAFDSTSCTCPKTHCGRYCEKASTCKNGGTCEYVAGSDTTRCVCPETHCGSNCEKTDCGGGLCSVKLNTCKHGGTCLYDATKNSVSCTCVAGFSGAACTSILEKVNTSGIDYRTIGMFIIPFIILLASVACGIMLFAKKRRRDEEEENRERQRLLEQQVAMEEEAPGFFAFLGF